MPPRTQCKIERTLPDYPEFDSHSHSFFGGLAGWPLPDKVGRLTLRWRPALTKTTYVATAPDGSEHTRKTDRTYSHAVLLQGKNGWTLVGFCGRLDLAQKKQGEHPGSIFVEVRELGATEADETKAEATEGAEHATQAAEDVVESVTPKLTISRLTEKLLMDENLGYAAIVDQVVAEFPDAKTTTRSVASVAAVMRKNGVDVPMRRKFNSPD